MRTIVRVELVGEPACAVRVRSRDGNVDVSAPLSAPWRARLAGKAVGYFLAEVDERTCSVEVEDAMPDQGWSVVVP